METCGEILRRDLPLTAADRLGRDMSAGRLRTDTRLQRPDEEPHYLVSIFSMAKTATCIMM